MNTTPNFNSPEASVISAGFSRTGSSRDFQKLYRTTEVRIASAATTTSDGAIARSR